MPDTSPAQGTLKRLIEAERQAREILEATEASAEKTVAEAREQARQTVDSVRRETAAALESRLKEAESKAAVAIEQHLLQAESQAAELQRRAEGNFSSAVELVTGWVTNRGDSS